MPRAQRKLVFYVDTECPLSTKERCSYYLSDTIQEQAAKTAKEVWGSRRCPMVFVKRGRNKFIAFCPTRGGPLSEQIPIVGSPGPNAARVEVQPRKGESWAEIIEKAAKNRPRC